MAAILLAPLASSAGGPKPANTQTASVLSPGSTMPNDAVLQPRTSTGAWLASSERDAAGHFLPGNTTGVRFTALAPAVVERMKTAFLAAVKAGAGVNTALDASEMPPGNLYRWAESDPEVQEAIEQAKRNRLAQLERKLDAVIEHPEEYDQALQRPSWMNAIMFRTKYLEPGYRDNAQVNVNVGVQVQTGDIDQAVAAYYRRKGDRQRDQGPS